MSSIPNVVEAGNVVTQGPGSAQERYYSYMLMKEKLGTSDRSEKILKSLSEKEEIEQQILEKLAGIKESSPEFSQVSEITGSTDKFEMARELASLVYDKTRAEQILSFYTPSASALKQQFFASQTSSARERIQNLAAGSALGSGKTIPEALAAVFGAPASR
jgi:hypothetical protein